MTTGTTKIDKDELIVLIKKICTEQCDAPYNDECEHDAIHCAMKYLIHGLGICEEAKDNG